MNRASRRRGPARRRAAHRRPPPPRRGRLRLPPAHWGLLVTVLATLVLALGLQAVTADIGPSGTTSAATGAVAVPDAAPVLFQSGTTLRSVELPDRTVALTFDDGPDPLWTPKVLDVLDREGVPATFFVLGANALRHPELVREIAERGDDLGNHTWSHSDLGTAPSWRRNLELSLGELGLAGSAGVSSVLLRPPYSSTPAHVTAADLSAYRAAVSAGYLVVLADRDTHDWTQPGTTAIVDAGAPVGTAGQIVLLHDGGGDRSMTVAALPALIERYRAAGYRFVTLSQGLGLPGRADPPAGVVLTLQGRVLGVAVPLSVALLVAVRWSVLVLAALALLRTALVVALARRHVRVSATRIAGPEYLPPVSVLVPAYNESVGIERTVRSLLDGDHPQLEVVVIDDGSTDGTAEIVESLGLPGVRVVRQENAGKAAALRRGSAVARHDVLVMLDGDTVFEPTTVRQIVQPLRDPTVGAVSGNTKVGNRSGLLGRWQHLEYVTGFNLDRRLLDLLGTITTVPGAAGAFRRQALDAAGGMSDDTLAEDTDITMAILRAGYRVVHEERARAWTEAPSSVNDLWRQRYRWGYGTMQCMWKHRAAVLDRGPGRRLGLVGIPFMFLFQVIMPIVAPAIDVLAVYGLLTGAAAQVLLVWSGFLALQLATTAYALRLDRESLRPLWSLAAQQFFYRQLIYLVVLQSIAAAVSGIRLPWHKLHRSGDVAVPA